MHVRVQGGCGRGELRQYNGEEEQRGEGRNWWRTLKVKKKEDVRDGIGIGGEVMEKKRGVKRFLLLAAFASISISLITTNQEAFYLVSVQMVRAKAVRLMYTLISCCMFMSIKQYTKSLHIEYIARAKRAAFNQ